MATPCYPSGCRVLVAFPQCGSVAGTVQSAVRLSGGRLAHYWVMCDDSPARAWETYRPHRMGRLDLARTAQEKTP